jgi:ZIP family zinc transporter
VVTLVLAAGRGRPSAVVMLAADALAPPVGVVLSSVLPLSGPALGVWLAVLAGVFLSIGTGTLLPAARERQPGWSGNGAVLLAATGGAGLVLAVRTVLG